MMNRRRFGGVLGAGLVFARSIAGAQPAPKMQRVGFLLGASGPSVASLFQALQEGLRDLGYVDGRNIMFVQRYGDGRMERLPESAANTITIGIVAVAC